MVCCAYQIETVFVNATYFLNVECMFVQYKYTELSKQMPSWCTVLVISGPVRQLLPVVLHLFLRKVRSVVSGHQVPSSNLAILKKV